MSAWAAERPGDCLFDLTPGAGKTLIMGRIAHAVLSAGVVQRTFVVVPTEYLRTQVARELSEVGVTLTDEFRIASKLLPTHVDGATLTYAQVAAAPEQFERLTRDAFVALDEVHHVGAHATWGGAVGRAFNGARHRLLFTGTPFRSDDGTIPFVQYHMGEAQALYRYGYADGLKDGIVRPAVFEVVGAAVKWTSSDGTENHRLTSEYVSAQLRAERLRAVVNSREWFATAFGIANGRLRDMRAQGHARAGGLVGAIDVEHARTIAKWIEEETGLRPVVVTSDDPGSIEKIDAFRASTDRWMVAVRQVSEGVNVSRLRAILWMTTTTSKLFFWQFVGRALRIDREAPADQEAFVVLPQDDELIGHAQTLEHAVRLWGWNARVGTRQPGMAMSERETKFGVLSTESFAVGRVEPIALEDADAEMAERTNDVIGAVAAARNPVEALKAQRSEVTRLVREFARASGQDHAKIHSTLNRRCGGASLDRSTPEMIARRVVLLERALRTGRLGA